VHVSTDHLFDGLTSLSTEQAAPRPLNVYASTKLQAEEKVLSLHPHSLVLRTNFFCWGSGIRLSFSDWVIRGLRRGVTLPMFEDVFFTPILADELVYCAHELLELNVNGIFNVVGSQRVSKYEYGSMLAEAIELPQVLIVRAKLENSELKAPRPKDMSLSNERLVRTITRQPGNLTKWFEQLLDQERDGRKRELELAVFNRIAEVKK
jgi:dTDP-4-dehydrorhamnose reductase